ncbi:MAG: TetR/AcrR family transcriptional regulator [Acidimicrobiia bacterium]|nr:TetR/AcrR family transcriptional regulator [Acidimicrobiia bacterium]
MPFSSEATEAAAAWRVRALRRSLDPAATRSMARLERLLDAARELTNESEGASFTVAEVAARAGVSLKSFYRSFEGKDDLLLALLEEESRTGAAMLRTALDRSASPDERLERYVRALFNLARQAPGYANVLVREYRRLSVERPAGLANALAPLVGLLEEEIAAAADAGRAAPGDVSRAAAIVFALLLDGLADMTLADRDSKEVAASVWRFVAGGLRLDDKEMH